MRALKIMLAVVCSVFELLICSLALTNIQFAVYKIYKQNQPSICMCMVCRNIHTFDI